MEWYDVFQFAASILGVLSISLLSQTLRSSDGGGIRLTRKICSYPIIAVNIILFAWLLFNKSAFQYFYHRGTGEPGVYYYGAYYSSLLMLTVGVVCSTVSLVLILKRKDK